MIVFIITTFLALLFITTGRIVIDKWINHLSMFAVIWWGMINLYELKMMRYIELTGFTWWVITLSCLAFYLGVLLLHVYRKFTNKKINARKPESLLLFQNNCKILKWIISITLILGALVTIQHWLMLLGKYGSIAGVILNGNEIYRLRVDGDLDTVPFVGAVIFISIFFTGIYTAYKNKINLLSIASILILLIRQIADFSRAGILFGIFIFVLSFILTRQYLSKFQKKNIKQQIKLVVIVILFMSFAVGGAGIVRSTRGSIEHFQASSRELGGMTNSFFITPSLYLYLSSHIAVLSKFNEIDYYNDYAFGGKSLKPIHNFLSKFGFTENLPYYGKGYFVPMWTNTSTWITDFIKDYGPAGIFLCPFLISLLTTFSWLRFIEEGKILHLAIATFMGVLILFSFLGMYSTSAYWFISFLIVLVILFFTEFIPSTKIFRLLNNYSNKS